MFEMLLESKQIRRIVPRHVPCKGAPKHVRVKMKRSATRVPKPQHGYEVPQAPGDCLGNKRLGLATPLRAESAATEREP